jgi:hypothetical protein
LREDGYYDDEEEFDAELAKEFDEADAEDKK